MLKPLDFEVFLKSPIGRAKNFTWKEALYLSRWDVCIMPTNERVFFAIEIVAEKMQKIRDHLQKEIRVTSWFRPQKYNDEIKGAKSSSHLVGMACDFQILGMDADSVRLALFPKLDELNIRMENLPQSNWTHIDINCNEKTPKEKRFFKP